MGEVGESARETLDAEGSAVTPGFVDVHTHYDAQVFWDPKLSPSCYHGVTTVFGGHCGFSIAPLSPEAAPYLLRMLARVEGMPEACLEAGVAWNWRSFGEYLGQLDGNLGLNAGFLAGHCALRRVVMGERAVGERANASDVRAMQELLSQSLEEGAIGFSSTLSTTHNDADGQPVPSRHASVDEILDLARVVGRHEGTSIEFLPGVGLFSDEVRQLMSEISTESQRPVNWNVLNPGPPELMDNQLGISDIARRNGGKVVALTMPQPIVLRLNLHGGMVFDAMQGWADLFKLTVPERMAWLASPAHRQALDRSARSGGPFQSISDWRRWQVHAVFDAANKGFEGRTIGDIAAEQGKAPFDAMLDLALTEGLRTSFIPLDFGGGTDEGLWRRRGQLWADERTVIGASDAGAHLDMIDTFTYATALLRHGVCEQGVITLEEAVRQLTQVPAALFGLRERGVLRPGWHADLVVFDPDAVAPGTVGIRQDLPAGEPRVYAEAEGIHQVFVNGVRILDQGRHTGSLPGKVMRSGIDTRTPTLD
ncbi:MAG: amidohydrolase family protein [Gammaproteobacteria bacterium]|nr:amidohydrolase family protein [Gammaproteobacteria bacterium]